MNTIFLVFDNSIEANFLELNLKENGYNVLKFSNWEMVLKSAKENYPNLIVINFPTPENEIVEYCKQFKANKSNTRIVSLVDFENYYSSPYIDYLMTKPIRPKLLLSIIRSLMQHEVINWYPSIL